MRIIRRIVMLTPDIQIDRRILLEAKSLTADGKEIIIIAGNDGKMPEYEISDGIKIRRPLYNGGDSRLLWMSRIYRGFCVLVERVYAALVARFSERTDK